MQLYLIRHGEAAPRSLASMQSDAERPLTDAGADQMRKSARALRRIGVEFDEVLTSPLRRAFETAQIVCEVLKCPERLRNCPELAPGCSLEVLTPVLRSRKSAGAVALVGHNPDVEELASDLIGGGPECGITFKKGGVCRIDVGTLTPRPAGTLIWHLTPKLLQIIGG